MVQTYATRWGGREYTARAADLTDAKWYLCGKIPDRPQPSELGDVRVINTKASSYGAFGRYDH